MGLPIIGPPHRLPRRFPVGAKFVVEGYGAEEGDLRVIARYVVLPDGQRMNVPAGFSPPSARALAFRRHSARKHSAKGGATPAKKIASAGGTRCSK